MPTGLGKNSTRRRADAGPQAKQVFLDADAVQRNDADERGGDLGLLGRHQVRRGQDLPQPLRLAGDALGRPRDPQGGNRQGEAAAEIFAHHVVSLFPEHSPGQRAVAAGPLGEAGKDRFQLGVAQNPQWAKLHVDRRGHLIRPGVEGHADNSLPINARPSVADPAGTYPIRPDHVVPAARFQAGATQETEHAGFGSDAVGIAEHDIELFQRPVGPQPEREHVAGQVLGRKTAAHRGQVSRPFPFSQRKRRGCSRSGV